MPLLLERGHAVAGLTRSQGDLVLSLGAEPIVCDVYDTGRLRELVGAFAPTVVVHLLTDLPDDIADLPHYRERNSRIRREGTESLLAAAPDARFVAQSVAFDAGPAVADLERMIPDFIRLPLLCGPGTYDPECTGDGERIHVADAARLFLERIERPPA